MPDLHSWNPEDRGFWVRSGRAVATRNLGLSIPALTLAFAVWMLWSVVVEHLPALGIGFAMRDPGTSYGWMVALSLLCGLGGAKFASSMAHISHFFPMACKGQAVSLNASVRTWGWPWFSSWCQG